MNNAIQALRSLGQLLNEAATCRACGKSKLVRATGRRGELEEITIETHCTCSGGPCDQAGLKTEAA